ERAIGAIELFVEQGIVAAMNRYNPTPTARRYPFHYSPTMNLSVLSRFLQATSGYHQLVDRLAAKGVADAADPIALNVLGAARPYLLAVLQQDLHRPLLVITAKPDDALMLFRQLEAWTASPANILHYPESENLPVERTAASLQTRQKRLAVLDRLSS